MRASRLAVTVSALGLALAVSGTALAAHGYRIRDAAWHRPPSGSLFSVNAHGIAARKGLVYVYLDRHPCRSTWASEATRFTTFEAGQSYFRSTGRAVITLRVSGRFNTSFTAHAGATARPEYACAYLTTRNVQGRYTVTAAHASNEYFVTN